MFYVKGTRKLAYCLDLVWVGSDAIFIYKVAKDLNLSRGEAALFCVEYEVSFLKTTEHIGESTEVVVKCTRKYNIIKVANAYVSFKTAEDVIHHALKRCRSITKPERRNIGLEKTVQCNKSCFFLCPLFFIGICQ